MRKFAYRFLAAASASLALVAATAAQPGGPTPCTISICPNGTGSGYYVATPTFDATGCPQGPLPPAMENGTMYGSVTMQAGGTGGTASAGFELSLEFYDYTNGVEIYSKGGESLPGVSCESNPCDQLVRGEAGLDQHRLPTDPRASVRDDRRLQHRHHLQHLEFRHRDGARTRGVRPSGPGEESDPSDEGMT